jgi:PAS domain S-box-containing protein
MSQEEQALRLILKTVSEGIYGLDPHGAITFINPAGARMLGYEPEALVGRCVLQGGSEGWTSLGFPLEAAVQEGCHEDLFWRADGSCFFTEYTISRIQEQGADLGAVITFRDIGARKQAELELHMAHGELQRLSALKDEFLSTISHELRTPLAAIRNAVAIVAKEKAGPLNETQARFLSMTREHVDRLHRLVDDVLDFQKLEAGSMTYHPTVADLRPLVLEVANGYSTVFAERRIQLQVQLPSHPLTARFDRDRLAQVLLNLLSNAAKFTPEGGRVRLSGEVVGNDVRLGVEDSGKGLQEGDMERVFHKFVQVDSSLTRPVGGTGLGLAICKAIIVDGHGGRIWAESPQGHGARFWLALPLREPEGDWLVD